MADRQEKPLRPVTKTEDPIISQIGDFRRYQLFFFFLILLCKFGTGWHTLGHIFLAAPTPQSCTTPNVTDPCSHDCWDTEFDTSVFKSTIITEWDLTCDRKQLASLSQSIVMLGVLCGSLISGMLADRVGRRPAFLTSCFMQLITGLIVCVSPYFWFYCFFRFLVAVATAGTMTTSFVLLMEIVGPKKREMVAIFYQLPFNIGHASLAVFAYFIREWRWFQFSITIFSAVFVIYICLVPESPRWLFTTGRVDKSIKILEKIAKCNRAPTETVRPEIEAAYAALAARQPLKKGTMLDLFRTPFLRVKTICMANNWLVVCMVYYGTAQYVSKLGGNIFVSNLIAAGVGVPGTCLCVLMTKFLGRKKTLLISNGLSAVGLILLAALSAQGDLVKVACATIGLFGASVTFPNVYLYGGELFPTVVRSNGVGLCSMIGRIGSILAPLICDLDSFGLWIAPLIFGLFSILAMIGTIFIPETRGAPLPETLEDGETFGRSKKALN
ncbi:organic cation transporter protein [Drosophila rhopaloa]|uniref:Organic cation transporter protein n=1 Tax=Drosophila rhopaloa TaxID=1041015 RepID=A0A6P4FLP5_DRORH|nr:organic cation transporter protein [Drosophila rhopaloa]XP_016986192.1 organic cation transporter protein [Drosophila rhopaloa]XP_016986193.1 organic cation transporter protein [Drosophila rhopaloa]XP_016986194.1 organic cation transporter protein [Drosophila rhopaloa]XP_016986195.1 organic cation transporter protein [Drosophila rhopaloa]XP_016986196.1 organic cation transporter protein [Drosophila rhopaloa]